MSGRGNHVSLPPREGEEKAPSMHHDGSFGKYMEFKNSKLHEQFREEQKRLQGGGAASSIFRGVLIHVNGITRPTHQELKRLMALHGGGFANYYSKETVTHIVCDHLPDTKLKQMLKSRSALPLVKAAWVVSSITAGKLLPPTDFALDRLTMAPAQQRLAPQAVVPEVQLQKADFYAQLSGAEADNSNLQQTNAAIETVGSAADDEPSLKRARVVLNATDTSTDLPEAAPWQPWSLVKKPVPQSTIDEDTTWGSRQIEAAHRTAASMRAATDVLKGPPKSSADDAGFMDTFFKASRLHFIGTWKMRIEELLRNDAQKLGLLSRPLPAAQRRITSKQCQADRLVMHVDMDCFFASVSVRNRPELQGVPLAVAHSNHSGGHSEISCVNYIARKAGVSAAMWMAQARERCPDLVVIPYEFDAYHEVSEAIYRILLQHAPVVQPMSCDEAYLDITGVCDDPVRLAEELRTKILEATKCNASVGIGPSILLANMATRKAKPNGVFRIQVEEVDSFLLQQNVSALPGVGWSGARKLEDLGIKKISDLRACPVADIQRVLGSKSGEELINYAYGRDHREVSLPAARKSVGAEVNYGIRFQTQQNAATFLKGLSGEVAKRLVLCSSRGHTVTLKLKRKRPDAPKEPTKFLGHGLCNSFSKSLTVRQSICSAEEICKAAQSLFNMMAIPPDEVRGVGIVVSKFDGHQGCLASVGVPGDSRQGTLLSDLWKADAKAPVPGANVAVPSREAASNATAVQLDNSGCDADGLAMDYEDVCDEDLCDESEYDSPNRSPVFCEDSPSGKNACVDLSNYEEERQDRHPVEISHRDIAEAVAEVLAAEPEAIVIDSPEAANPADVPVSGPIVALPAAHQLDMSVLDSLPATMRLELMREYGMHAFGARRPMHSKPLTAKAKCYAAGASGRGQGGGLEGSLRRIQEAGKSSKGKPKGPPPFRSIFDVPETRNVAAMNRPAAQPGHTRMRLQLSGQQGVVDAAAGTGCDNRTNSPEAPASMFSMNEILQHCRQGGILDVQVLSEATQARVHSVVESELAKLQLADVSGCSVKENVVRPGTTSGQGSQEKSINSQQRLKTLLTLLASWHAVCLRAEKFVCAKQLCATVMSAEKHSSVSSKKMIRKYVNTVQQVCKKMHGFVLDIPSAA